MFCFSGDGNASVASADHGAGGRGTPVAQIGENTYSSLEAAIGSAEDGNTITLPDNVDLGEMTYDKELTLELGSHTLNIKGMQNFKKSVTFKTDSTPKGTIDVSNVVGHDGLFQLNGVDATNKVTLTFNNVIATEERIKIEKGDLTFTGNSQITFIGECGVSKCAAEIGAIVVDSSSTVDCKTWVAIS